MFIKNNRGYGLLEVLMAGALGAIVVAGSLKGLSLSVQNSQVVRATLDDTEFRNAFKDKVTEQACKHSLALSSEKGTGEVAELADSASDTDKLVKGRWRDTSINIIKFDLKALTDPADDPKVGNVQRRLFAYYKKEGLGELSTVGGEACTSADQAGCYFATCLLDYKTAASPDSNNNNKYPVQDCEVKSCTQADEPPGCGPGSYLRGWDDDGVPDCVSVAGLTADANPCPFGTVLTGYDTSKSPPRAICTGQVNCPEGKTLNPQGACVEQKRTTNLPENPNTSLDQNIRNIFMSTEQGCDNNIITLNTTIVLTFNGFSNWVNWSSGYLNRPPILAQSYTQEFKDRLKREIDSFCNPRSKHKDDCKIIKVHADIPNSKNDIVGLVETEPINENAGHGFYDGRWNLAIDNNTNVSYLSLSYWRGIYKNPEDRPPGTPRNSKTQLLAIRDINRQIKLTKEYDRETGEISCNLIKSNI